ncbi:MAG: hypothetical protein IT495_15650, partial [Gammaproteobacteria bacterium]|nr:hypothetical protein [Gammaproteobacteria bacterium]
MPPTTCSPGGRRPIPAAPEPPPASLRARETFARRSETVPGRSWPGAGVHEIARVAPSLMVLDNRTATINVGDEIPIPTRQATSNIDPDAPTVNEIQYRTTGVILAVTPRVNAGGLVT